MPEIIDPVFAKTSQNARFLLSENERFGLVFVKTGSINSGTEEIGLLTRSTHKNYISLGRIDIEITPTAKSKVVSALRTLEHLCLGCNTVPFETTPKMNEYILEYINILEKIEVKAS